MVKLWESKPSQIIAVSTLEMQNTSITENLFVHLTNIKNIFALMTLEIKMWDQHKNKESHNSYRFLKIQ